MAKNIVIQNGSDPVQYLNGVTRIRTELQEGGYCDWMPEDEVDLKPGGSGGSGGSSGGNLIEKTITRNGEYDAALDDGADGYSKVNIELPFGNKTISSNGTFRASDDAFVGYGAVTVNVGTDYLGDTTEVAAYIERNMSVVSNSYVSRVAPYAFYSNGTLRSVNFPNATEIGEGAFEGCSKLEKIYFDSVKIIRASAFYNCPNVMHLKIPNAEVIGSYAFENCKQINQIEFSKISLINIGTFYNCSSLKMLYANNASAIEEYAFKGCTSLSALSIPLVTSVGAYAFSGCTSLSSLSMPLVTSIGAYAFRDCGALIDIYLLFSSVASLYGTNVFYNTPISVSTITGSYGSIYVLESMVNIYKSARYWSAYSDRITAYEE